MKWEKGTAPFDRYWPRIVAFLGYDPMGAAVSLAARLIARRRSLGLSRKATAKVLGVDEGTLMRWETEIWSPTGRRSELVARFLSG